jgi:hypothetical protein
MRLWMGANGCCCLVLCFAGLLSGCGGGKAYHLSGKATFKGKDIPEGYIIFEPDGSKGNMGQPGRAKILDGQYSTRDEDGMSTVGGPHVIRIVAHNAKMDTSVVKGGEVVMPDLLFPPYSFNQDLPSEHSEVDFDVPAEAAKKK